MTQHESKVRTGWIAHKILYKNDTDRSPVELNSNFTRKNGEN